MKSKKLTLTDLHIDKYVSSKALHIDKYVMAAEIFTSAGGYTIGILREESYHLLTHSQRVTVLEKITDISDMVIVVRNDEVLSVFGRTSVLDTFTK